MGEFGNVSEVDVNTEVRQNFPYEAEVPPNVIPSFLSFLEKYGPTSVVALLNLHVEAERKRGKIFSPQDQELVEILTEAQKNAVDHGLNLFELRNGGLNFRYVAASGEYDDIEDMVEKALEYGGKNPSDSRVGVCMDAGYKVAEYIRIGTRQNGHPGLLFIYDNSKLRPLTKEEVEADKTNNFVGGYGRKPIAGLELKDTLVGVIKIRN